MDFVIEMPFARIPGEVAGVSHNPAKQLRLSQLKLEPPHPEVKSAGPSHPALRVAQRPSLYKLSRLSPGGLPLQGGAAIRASNMSVSSEQVRHIAKLARIAMSDEEIERLVPELNNILGWGEQLGEVNTDGIEPLTAVIDQELRLRDDEVTDGNCRDAVLANAPGAEHGFFAVPKVIE